MNLANTTYDTLEMETLAIKKIRELSNNFCHEIVEVVCESHRTRTKLCFPLIPNVNNALPRGTHCKLMVC